jgi:hypothetical protein
MKTIPEVKEDLFKYGDHSYPSNAIEFSNWLNELINSVPPDCRNSITIDIDVNRFSKYSDNSSLCFEIYYYRPKNKEECDAENEKNKAIQQRVLKNKYDEYVRLKSIFD